MRLNTGFCNKYIRCQTLKKRIINASFCFFVTVTHQKRMIAASVRTTNATGINSQHQSESPRSSPSSTAPIDAGCACKLVVNSCSSRLNTTGRSSSEAASGFGSSEASVNIVVPLRERTGTVMFQFVLYIIPPTCSGARNTNLLLITKLSLVEASVNSQG